MITILITGVAGLLGSRLANYILDTRKDIKVIGIDDFSGGYKENVSPDVKLYVKNLAKDDISSIFSKNNIDYVFHFAAYAAEGLSPFLRKFNYSNNILSTVNIINNCINYNVKRLIYTSSMSVYGHGNLDGTKFDEDLTPNPIDPYGISKYAMELDIKVAGIQHGLDWCILRPHNVFGVNQNIWDRYRNVIGIWMYQILNNSPMTIYGDGNQVRSFTYIDNILPCLLKSAFNSNCSKQIINLGGKVPYTINYVNQMLQEITGYDKVNYLDSRFEVKHAVPTYIKSEYLLDYKESINLRAGLQEMWNWAKNSPIKMRFKWDNFEISKGLYNYWKN